MSTDVWDAYCDWLNAPSGSTKEEAMKVQHRSKDIIGIEWEAVDEAKAYYIVKDPAGFLRVLDKKDYEPVEEWVDVNMSTLTFDESMDDAYLCDDGRILFKRTAWANGKGHGAPTDVYRITGLQRKVKR